MSIPGYSLLAGALLLATGCASTTTFKPYPARIDPLIEEIRQNKPVNLEYLARDVQGVDRILYRLERGRLAQIQGFSQTSRADFQNALEAIEEKEGRAVLSASKTAGVAAAVLVNDNAIPYLAEGYERVMLHHFQAMNFLAENDLEGAGVEVRRANFEQVEALRRHEKEIEEAQAEAGAEKTAADQAASAFAGLDEVAGKVKNSFQNAYTFFLSAVVYEMMGQSNDAYIDYKKALEIFPENTYLQRDVLRLARALKMDEELSAFQRRFRLGGSDPEIEIGAKGAGFGEIVLLFEDGFLPRKKEVKIPVPLLIGGEVKGFTAAAFPFYEVKWTEPAPLSLAIGARQVGSTEPICYLDALAVKALKEKVPGMVARQVVRSTAKAAAALEAKKRLGFLGELGASLYNLASENADLRNWITLPANAQILRTALSAGKHRLSLAQAATGARREIEVEIREGATTILRVVRAGDQLYALKTGF